MAYINKNANIEKKSKDNIEIIQEGYCKLIRKEGEYFIRIPFDDTREGWHDLAISNEEARDVMYDITTIPSIIASREASENE